MEVNGSNKADLIHVCFLSFSFLFYKMKILDYSKIIDFQAWKGP